MQNNCLTKEIVIARQWVEISSHKDEIAAKKKTMGLPEEAKAGGG